PAMEEAGDEELRDGGDEAHSGDGHDEARQRADHHELATDAIGEAAPERAEEPGQSGGDGHEEAGPHRDLGGIAHAQLLHEQRQEGGEELEAHESGEDDEGQRPDVALPALRPRPPPPPSGAAGGFGGGDYCLPFSTVARSTASSLSRSMAESIAFSTGSQSAALLLMPKPLARSA